MNERSIVLLGIVAAFGVAALTVLITDEPSILVGDGPLAIAIFLTIGIAVPQYLLYRRDRENARLGTAALAVAGSATVLLGSEIAFRVFEQRITLGIVELLVIVVLGAGLSASIQAFVEGFQSAS